MAVTGILRVGLVQIKVLDFDESLVHYRDRIGLDIVGNIDEDRIMLKTYDEFDHHSLVLHKADTAGIDFIAFKADNEKTVNKIIEKTKSEYGFDYEIMSDQPGYGEIHTFTVPTGHKIGIYNEVELAEDYPMIRNPYIWKKEPKGMAPTCFDHALLYGPDQATTVKWLTEVLGLAITEILLKEDGENHLCTWLSANTRGHDLAVLDFPEPNVLHHISFHLEDWHAVGHAADIMARYEIKIDAGPMRHGITRGQTIYFFDPSGNRNETFAGGYEFFPDHPVRIWDADHAGAGIFYYDKALNDRFLSVYS
ncbi:catechol 2,3-dioxygenase [Miniphocaeibacter massiliensis]|uniref:catechol 2,3-dioxygenase n=1 Tax=Miniphocaeibacter massiliensis TaxID=2041841 RepID=UPI000C06FC8F|nr:catechol 2,3-dioxygenase [Miniphocaeibacter massiliensis]